MLWAAPADVASAVATCAFTGVCTEMQCAQRVNRSCDNFIRQWFAVQVAELRLAIRAIGKQAGGNHPGPTPAASQSTASIASAASVGATGGGGSAQGGTSREGPSGGREGPSVQASPPASPGSGTSEQQNR